MKRTLASRAALIGLAVAIGGCTSSAKRTALPEGTRFTAATDASSVAATRLLADGNYGLAIEMYRRFGFRSAGRRRRYYHDNGEDALIMWLEAAEGASVA